MADPAAVNSQVKYIGFWKRFVAFLVDSLAFGIVLTPVFLAVYGGGYLENLNSEMGALLKAIRTPGADPVQVLEMLTRPGSALTAVLDIRVQIAFGIAILLFWKFRNATPGKMLVRAKIVNARTLGKPSTGQLIGRLLAYMISIIPLCLGFLWIAFDPRKQGWHDKLAGTAVIRAERL